MPSLAVHMAIAKKFMESNKIENKEEFMRGTKEPDYIALQGQKEKEQAHFSDAWDPQKTAHQRKESKANLFNYLTQKTVETDFEKGYFLHLVVDYLFFSCFFPFNRLKEENIPFQTIYDDYEKIAKLMEEKYGVDNSSTPWKDCYQNGEPILFSKKEICDFVEVCSSFDLEKIRKIVLSSKENWREKTKEEYYNLQKKMLKK